MSGFQQKEFQDMLKAKSKNSLSRQNKHPSQIQI